MIESNDETRRAKCPICRIKVEFRDEGNNTFPFCSDRCQMHDLGNWINEAYTLPIDQNSTERKLVEDFAKNLES